MLLHILMIFGIAGWSISAPTGDCDGDVECMYRRLQLAVKPLPCKRMLGRHGKRSAEEVDCEDEEEKTVTTSSPEKKIFIEHQLSKLGGESDDSKKREMVVPLRDDPLDDILSTDTNKRKLETVEDNSQISKSSEEQPDTIESLNSEIDLLKSKIAALQSLKNKQKDVTTRPAEVPASESRDRTASHQAMRKKLEAVEDDIDEVLSLLPNEKPRSNLYQLQLLSQRLAAEEARRKMAEQTTTKSNDLSTSDSKSLISSDANLENVEDRLDKLSKLINNLIEVDKIAYTDLKEEVDKLKANST